jgi:hydroxymethylbilane synthase
MVRSRAFRIGTRGSRLALWQADYIAQLLRHHHPEVILERVIIKTEGDRDQQSSLTRIGGLGIFTKAIEEALLDKRIDIAVHSLKDLPSTMADGLVLAAVPERGAVQDALVSGDGRSFRDLPQGAQIATGSIRRRAQLLYLRPDLQMSDLRGNIDTRLKQLHTRRLDGLIMARAALERLQLRDVAFHLFEIEDMIPAVGQGAVGVQIRNADAETKTMVSDLNHVSTYQSITAERAFLQTLDSGCQFPVGAFARVQDHTLRLQAFVGSEDGREVIKDVIEGQSEQSEELGRALAERFIEKGAQAILGRVND